MDPETVRQRIVAGIDRVLGSSLLGRWLSADARADLAAQRAFWQSADGPTLARLVALYPGD